MNSGVIGGKPKQHKNNGHEPIGITDPAYWEKDFENMPWYNKIEKILEIPSREDMAGVMARAVFKTDRQRIAAVRLAYRHKKFKDNNHQEMLRMWLASTIGMRGLGRLDGLFAATNLIAPDMYRIAMDMPRKRGQEQIQRGSDFREEREEVAKGNEG